MALNIQLKDSGDATPLESGGSAERLDAELTGKNYEQITSALKAKSTGAETEQEVSEPESPAPAEEEAGGEDDLRLMTDEEIKALPQELQREAKALKKRLLGAYTRKTQDLADIRRRAEFADRFETDPDFRTQVIREYGLHPQPTGQQVPPPTGQVQVPPQYVQMRRNTLPEQMQWLAESLALGDFQRDVALYQGYIQPLQQRYEDGQQNQAQREYEAAVTAFSDQQPGWDEHEDDMVDLVEYLKSPSLTHPRWGSKHALLYRIVTGNDQEPKIVQKVMERTAQAIRNKSVTGGGGRTTTPNIEERVKTAKTEREAWDLARAAAKGARA